MAYVLHKNYSLHISFITNIYVNIYFIYNVYILHIPDMICTLSTVRGMHIFDNYYFEYILSVNVYICNIYIYIYIHIYIYIYI